ncbi:bifunctional UDP-N-acetylglucosamine diphosphorylase/glucosamine-1-phosphate N-acetyltransferase GlmU [Thioalkalivibrio sp. HK1]|uniref:bifunctional UDP-N-acetylglucosamine diphosphorylase/glucosamine-1-phosphate N-acetyltransferase GlmU n=1 Tax=Thioalkalivibrio sp. HK1 TaxID=1469245 RepID=UPI0004706570|nr:bifunctional UDP-N-acetylglucosamine diphosphorylase/glucosamine-1-phosphate N-acetyltransferase GlmU [Thioalkalivibrio sp. HK1]
MKTPLHVVILAAGKGRRMRSNLPKVLHLLAGRPLLSHVVAAACEIDPTRIHVVHGHRGDLLRKALGDSDIEWVEQKEQLGTGHALAQALPSIPDEALVMVLYGDVPLISPSTLRKAMAARDIDGARGIALVTLKVDDPHGYGRILRDDRGRLIKVIEEVDANEEQRGIREINTGILTASAGILRPRLQGDSAYPNAQGECYLTDILARAAADGYLVRTVSPKTTEEVLGVNDRVQLARLERFEQMRIAESLMRDGTGIADPARIDIRGRLRTGIDVFIDIDTVFEGEVVLEDGVRIGPGCVIKDATIGYETEIFAHSVIEGAEIGASCRIGPFARLRPNSRISHEARIGNFVEIKNGVLGRGAKANHLSYLGDARIGARANIGAGSITCNYDGANKHPTVIGDGAFVGSGVMLVAPITVHRGATIGAGSTITKDAPPDTLTLSRAPQRSLKSWRRKAPPEKGDPSLPEGFSDPDSRSGPDSGS